MSNKITLQRVSKLSSVPANRLLKKWLSAAINNRCKNADITLRIVNNRESALLNQTYRYKKGPTNVLSFVYETKPVCGDIVLCAPLIAKQAKAQKKSIALHWAHLIVHGILHLLGYDHHTKKQTAQMEKLEIKILQSLGFENPY